MKPNMRRRSIFLLLSLVLLAQEGIAQTKYAEKNRNERSVVLVKEFANRAFSFEDQSTRVLSLARFADLLWLEDEAYARQLFTRALDSCTPKTGAAQKEIDRLARL